MQINQLSQILGSACTDKNSVCSADRLNEIVKRVLAEENKQHSASKKQTPKILISPHKESFKEMVDKYLS